jgi:ABC-2 type transport system ATP-binding protein
MCDAIGIIERGQLIVSGTVSEIQAELRPHLDVLVRLISRGEELGRWLEEQEKIFHVQASDMVVRFQFASQDPREQTQLLQAIVQSGWPVLEYSTESRSLEDVFLHITTGAVQ